MNGYEKMIIIASGILLVLNLFDGLMTYWGLSLKIIQEGNPLMRVLIAKYPSEVMSTKLILPVFLGVLCWVARKQSQRLIMYSLSLVLVIYLLTDLMHIFWWLKIR